MQAHEEHLWQVQFVEEKVSCKVSWRKRKIADTQEPLSDRDNIIVSKLSRLGRSMPKHMKILSIAKQERVSVYTLKGNWQLVHRTQSKIVAMAFSMAAEIERDFISYLSARRGEVRVYLRRQTAQEKTEGFN